MHPVAAKVAFFWRAYEQMLYDARELYVWDHYGPEGCVADDDEREADEWLRKQRSWKRLIWAAHNVEKLQHIIMPTNDY